jgi:hypothetical protein
MNFSSRTQDACAATRRRAYYDSRSPWQDEYDRLAKSITQAVHRPPGVELIVGTGEHVLVCFPLPGGAFELVVQDIQPGRYRIGTDTGWQLWSGDLLENDLCLGAAHQSRVVSLAAQDAPPEGRPARTLDLGETRLRADVFPGFESGAIRIYRPAEGGVE